MRYVCFEQALEVQVGGHFYSFAAGNYYVEDELAEIVVANYHDRGAGFGTLPSEGGSEVSLAPEPVVVEVEPVAEAETPDETTDAPSTRRSRVREK